MSVFDGLPDIFTQALGDPVVYTRSGGSPVTINGIIEKHSMDIVMDAAAGSVGNAVTVSVRAVDVPQLAEGDLFDLPLDGVTFHGKATQPIRSDGKGMTTVSIAAVS